ncbi:MAG: hypothetical protein KKD69_02450 [Euryarchaeota archaeon]|nr:hypothetical protein [Euryarchaeota archaeon]
MNTNQTPPLQEWKELYGASLEFKELAPWDWMYDSDLFGVQDPVSGEIGYCCIMGAAGEHYALGLYSGSEGLMGLSQILTGEFTVSQDEVLYIQKCLMVSFEDRKYLQKQDLQQIKAFGLKFRGCNAWPLFRNYTPGLVPWYLTRDEARFLTIALQQAIDVSTRFKKDAGLLVHPSRAHYFVRVPRKQGENIVWQDEWLEPLPLKKEDHPAMPVDETILSRLKKAKLQRRGIWEVDFFYIPAPIWEKGERPYYPYMSLLVNHNSAFILNFQIERQAVGLTKFPVKFVELIERVKVMPEKLLVKRNEVYRLLEPITAKLSIEITAVESLPALEYAKIAMKGFL